MTEKCRSEICISLFCEYQSPYQRETNLKYTCDTRVLCLMHTEMDGLVFGLLFDGKGGHETRLCGVATFNA